MALSHIEFTWNNSKNQQGERATMIVASHELKGKVETLKQPFVVMRPCKRLRNEDGCSELMSNNHQQQSNDNKKRKSGYEIAGIVRTKILFDKYPKSIMR